MNDDDNDGRNDGGERIIETLVTEEEANGGVEAVMYHFHDDVVIEPSSSSGGSSTATRTTDYYNDRDQGDDIEECYIHNNNKNDSSVVVVAEEAEENEDDEKKTTENSSSYCCRHPRIQELYRSADWWSLWIGLASFALAVALVFGLVEHRVDDENDNENNNKSNNQIKYIVPQPEKWKSNPVDAWNLYNGVGIPLLLTTLGIMYLTSLAAMGKLKSQSSSSSSSGNNENDNKDNKQTTTTTRPATKKAVQYIAGFACMSAIATIAFWLGRNEWLDKHGLGYAVWAILLGMFLTNGATLLCSNTSTSSSTNSEEEPLQWLLLAAKDGEFFIKCSLVLLAVELNVLVSVGGPGMLVAWIGSPLAIAVGYGVGWKLFKCKDTLSMLIAVGASWCGASAISAVAPIVSAGSEEVSLAISVVAFFTVIFTFAQPYFAMAVGMPDDVAGAWIGASVDQTGNVVVSAAIISDESTEIAGIVKMVLNAGLGVMASVVSCYWTSHMNGTDGVENKKFTPIMLWDKFPKFTLGFIITSAILTVLIQNLEGTLEAEALPSAISTVNKWWFSIAFVGVGLTTNVKKLWAKAWESGVIQVYLFANTVDILLALGLAYLVYS